MEAKIDLEKFICSYLKWNNIQDALKDQGLKCWNDKIVEISQESEDGKIRKALISVLKSDFENDTTIDDISVGDIIAWLEKQKTSEEAIQYLKENHSPSKMSDFQAAMNIAVAKAYDKGMKDGLEKQSEQNPYSGVSFKYNGHTFGMCARDGGAEILMDGNLKAFISLDKSFVYPVNPIPSFKAENFYVSKVDGLIHDSTYNPTDKVEPKFNVGDWITDGHLHCKITDVLDDRYIVDTKFAKRSAITFKRENDYHLWTIQDAKNGDVLSYVTDEEDLWIMIYWSLYEPYEGHVHYHALLVNDNFSDKGTCCICINDLKPATKEQRDMLFQKMEEAGYKWDAEKKELNEIHVIDEGKAEMDYCFTKMMNGEKVTPAWSEEDELQMQGIIDLLPGLTIRHNWLKSIKERVQHPLKVERSEEDEKLINRIEGWLDTLCDYLKDSSPECIEDVKDVVEQLKSLKQGHTWKPSDAQIRALEYIIDNIQHLPYSCSVVKELLEQLKKLKGK